MDEGVKSFIQNFLSDIRKSKFFHIDHHAFKISIFMNYSVEFSHILKHNNIPNFFQLSFRFRISEFLTKKRISNKKRTNQQPNRINNNHEERRACVAM